MALPARSRTPAPPDSILGLMEAFRADPRPARVNLSSGVYVDETGITPVLPSVLEAERRILATETTKVYRPIDGDPTYRAAVRDLVFGADHEVVTSGRSATAHTPGGTGALRVAADFLAQEGGAATVWLPDPTWPNHPQLFSLAGYEVRTYPYLRPGEARVEIDALLDGLGAAREGDLVVLHGSCHNPTGVDPSAEDWRRIGDLLEERQLLPIVDFAYQGFGDGLREDADWMAGIVRPGMELLIATSYSKNFALYNERVGALTLVAVDAAAAESAESHVKIAIRANYSNPPSHGAEIVTTILGDPALRAQWEVELGGMRGRIHANRRRLVEALEARRIPGDWAPIARQRGMFALLGLSKEQVARLRSDHGVYVVGAGRINVAGITKANLDPFADALAVVVAG
ncbi:MAG: amino acid aminotransferase [Chloroflexota bacterium]